MNKQILTLAVLLGLQNAISVYAQDTNDATSEKVEYIKKVNYFEPHNNMNPSYKPYIIKKTTDKNGQIKLTYYGDPELSYMCGIGSNTLMTGSGGFLDATYLYGDIPVYYKSTPAIRYGTYQNFHSIPLGGKGEIDNLYAKTGVPDILKIEFTHSIRNRNELEWDYFSNLRDYKGFNAQEIGEYETLYPYGMVVQVPLIISEYTVEYPIYTYWGDLQLLSIRDGDFSTHSYIIQRYYLDGQTFDFFPFCETWDSDMRIEYITMPNGMPAKVLTVDQQTKTLGRDMYQCFVDTIYQLTPEEIAQMEAGTAKTRNLSTPHKTMTKPTINRERRTVGLKPEEK